MRETAFTPTRIVDEDVRQPSCPQRLVDEDVRRPSRPHRVVDEDVRRPSRPHRVVDEYVRQPSRLQVEIINAYSISCSYKIAFINVQEESIYIKKSLNSLNLY